MSNEPTSLLRIKEVERRTGLKRSTLYKWMKRGLFPKPVPLGTSRVAWRSYDVDDWVAKRCAAAALSASS